MYLLATRHCMFFADAKQASHDPRALWFPAAATPIKNVYDWTRSTEENYKQNYGCQQYGKYASIRQTLDYKYHSNYTRERQLVQDKIIDHLLNNTWIEDPTTGQGCPTSVQPWIVFTAGPMGAGKSWTIRNLSQQGYFPLKAFVTVDPDEIRRHLPEFEIYTKIAPLLAGELTRKEAGLVSEVLTLVALEQGHNVLVDGSLRDATWYQSYFTRVRQRYSPIKIGILHITAPSAMIYARAASRAQTTGRVVPHETLEASLHQVPKSVQQLSPLADFYAQLHNAQRDARPTIETPGLSWEGFQAAWIQSCTDGEQRRVAERTDATTTTTTCDDDDSTRSRSKL